MAPRIDVFDRRAVRRQRERAAATLPSHDFLFREAASRLVERLDEVRRTFPMALDLGGHGGLLREVLQGRGGIQTLVETDLSFSLARRAQAPRVVADEEFLPFAPGTFGLVLSCLSLHWVNDLPGALLQVRNALKPDGLLLVSLLGGDTLHELRRALLEAEAETAGGASPRVSPFADVREAGALLQRTGFALPVVDSDTITVSYPDALALMRDLRNMGEANALTERRRSFSRRDVLLRAAERYQTLFADAAGRIPATFRIVTLTAWAPHAAQPKPLRPGSAAARLAEALGGQERPAGEKTGR
ncbi:MAG TPA: methyltransferase domain-containing protein [Alphaproteobacteria bacterium]|nr:methyltransferase domain-containing protein [Alphaproteobacteria bacterium]